jgi:hypothetical protein
MADERYTWLDKDTAERFLRGEPVGAVDEHARDQAARLSRALLETAGVTYAIDAELPGEAAALAAFQRARVAEDAGARRGSGAAAPAGASAGGAAPLGTVRLARAPAARYAARFARPVRWGLAMVVTGCVVGSMAVAMGADLLPAPSLGEHSPLPANSVSAVRTPRPGPSGSGHRGPAPAGPSGGPALGTGQPLPGSPLSAAPRNDGDDGPGYGGTPGHGPGLPAAPNGESGAVAKKWYRKTGDICRDYRSGPSGPERKKALGPAAEGTVGARRFCDRPPTGRGRNGGHRDGGHEDGGHEDAGSGHGGGKKGNVLGAGDGDESPGLPGTPTIASPPGPAGPVSPAAPEPTREPPTDQGSPPPAPTAPAPALAPAS